MATATQSMNVAVSVPSPPAPPPRGGGERVVGRLATFTITAWPSAATGRLKEPVIHARLLRNLEEVRQVATEFRDRYNRHWRLERLGFMSPLEARQSHAIQKAA